MEVHSTLTRYVGLLSVGQTLAFRGLRWLAWLKLFWRAALARPRLARLGFLGNHADPGPAKQIRSEELQLFHQAASHFLTPGHEKGTCSWPGVRK